MILSTFVAISTVCFSAGTFIAVSRLFGTYCGILACIGVAAEGMRRFLMPVVSYKMAKASADKCFGCGSNDEDDGR